MSKDTIHVDQLRRFVFTNDGMRIEHQERADVGTVWRTVADFSDDELRQLSGELEKRGYAPSDTEFCRACGESYSQQSDGSNIHYCAECREMMEEQSPK